MSTLLTLILSNFTVSFFLLGLFAAGIELLRTERSSQVLAEALLRWFFFFSVGCSFLYNFVCHVFLGTMTARFIGWAPSPFQAEVGWASLGYALLGFLAFRSDAPARLLRIGTLAALSCFLLGAAFGHAVQMITAHNFAPGNAGAIFWTDLLLPAFGWVLLSLTGKRLF